MSKRRVYRLGDSQLKIIKVLWERDEASVNDVLDALGPEADLAYTTVATMLRRMEARVWSRTRPKAAPSFIARRWLRTK